MTHTGKAAAFFDLDWTLLTVNSGALWIKREQRLNRISRLQVLEAAFYLTAYRFSVINMEHAMIRGLKIILGEEERNIRAWTHQWYRDEVAPHEAPGARAALEYHRARGHTLVLLTSASLYESEVAVEHFDLDHFICTRYEVRQGRFTGDVIRPVCYGDGKVTLAERFAAERGVDLDASYFYTDSNSDLPMLRRVGKPRAVHPDPKLRRIARRAGWPILDWRGRSVR